MVSVDFNILIGVLVVFSVLAYVFVLRRIKTKQPNPVGIAASTEPTIEAAIADDTKTQERQQPKEAPKKKPSLKCDHHFGYLSNLPKKSKPPRECLQCQKVTECIGRKKPRKNRDKHIETILAIDEETEVPKQPRTRT
jgi:hypothetical protein